MIDLTKLQAVKTKADLDREAEHAAAIAYLQSTDWQVIAKYERKRVIPADVAAKRAEAIVTVTAQE